jgi:hypothetical protein
MEGTAPSPLRPKRSVILFYYIPDYIPFTRVPKLVVVRAQWYKVFRLVVLPVTIKMVNLYYQVPAAYTTLFLVV